MYCFRDFRNGRVVKTINLEKEDYKLFISHTAFVHIGKFNNFSQVDLSFIPGLKQVLSMCPINKVSILFDQLTDNLSLFSRS